MTPHIAIIVDHPLRDLGGCVLVAKEFVIRGARVSLVPMNIMNAEIFALKPDFVLLNYLRENNAAFVRHLLEANIQYGILDTEGGLYTNLDTYTNVFPDAHDVLDATRIYCSWGKKIADDLIQKRILRADQITITGLPRFDPYALHATTTDLAQRKCVLLNTKVSMANPGVHSLEKEIELYITKMGWSAERVYEMRDTGFETIKQTLAMANQLAIDFPEVDFVIRPHPHERLSTYQEGVQTGLSNLKADRSGSIDEWVPRISALIHRSCTTAIEASLAGVPALSPDWIPTSAAAADCDAVSIRCTHYEDLKTALKGVLAGSADAPKPPASTLQRIIDDWFYKIDGQSHKRVVDAIWPLLPKTRNVNESLCEYYLARQNEKLLSKRGLAATALKSLKWLLPNLWYFDLLYPARKAWKKSIKLFSASDIRTKLQSTGLTATPSDYRACYNGVSFDIVTTQQAN